VPDYKRQGEVAEEHRRGTRTERVPEEDGETVLWIERNERERIRLAKKTFNGVNFVDLRVYFFSRDSGAWTPSRKGLSIRPRDVAKLAEALASIGETSG